MGKEIEIKIPLTESEYEKIFSVIKDRAEHLKKSDEYYSKYDTREERIKNNEPPVIRIRTEQNVDKNQTEIYFCVKRKSVENGIEFNSENETQIQDGNPLRYFFEAAGYKKFFEKNKDAFSAYCKCTTGEDIDFHLELEQINGLKYVEIEVTNSDLAADVIRANLEKFVEQLGLDSSKRDSRSWMEILGKA
jgi:predicted adenylyl cyclase CyaB